MEKNKYTYFCQDISIREYNIEFGSEEIAERAYDCAREWADIYDQYIGPEDNMLYLLCDTHAFEQFREDVLLNVLGLEKEVR